MQDSRLEKFNMTTTEYIQKPVEIDSKKRLHRVFDTLSKHQDLEPAEAEFAARIIFDGLATNRFDVSDLLIAFFGGLTIKEPTLDELKGMAAAMEATSPAKVKL